MKFTKIIIAIIVINNFLFPQDSTSKFNNVLSGIYDSFKETVKWYDIPIYLSNKYSKNIFGNNGHFQFIKLTPLKFEKDFNNVIGSNGNKSLGSIDKDIYPTLLLTSRITMSIGRALLMNDKLNKNDLKHSIVFYKSIIYTNLCTEIIKGIVHKDRPDNSDSRSFFSGHSSNTFAASTFIYRELKDFYDDWDVTSDNEILNKSLTALSFTTLYGWSGYVAYSRIKDNKHYLLDVLLGAAVGVAISNFLYDSYFHSENNITPNFRIDPEIKGKYLGFSYTF